MCAFVVLGLPVVFPYQANRLSLGTSPKWPILCWVGRKTLTQSINQSLWGFVRGSPLRDFCSQTMWRTALAKSWTRPCCRFCNRCLVLCSGVLSSVATASLAAAVMYWYSWSSDWVDCSFRRRHQEVPTWHDTPDAAVHYFINSQWCCTRSRWIFVRATFHVCGQRVILPGWSRCCTVLVSALKLFIGQYEGYPECKIPALNCMQSLSVQWLHPYEVTPVHVFYLFYL